MLVNSSCEQLAEGYMHESFRFSDYFTRSCAGYRRGSTNTEKPPPGPATKPEDDACFLVLCRAVDSWPSGLLLYSYYLGGDPQLFSSSLHAHSNRLCWLQ